jgi:hypothetical protein
MFGNPHIVKRDCMARTDFILGKRPLFAPQNDAWQRVFSARR